MTSTADPRPVGTAVDRPAPPPAPAGSEAGWVRRHADPLARLLGAAAAGGLLVAAFPPYADYQVKADRQIPLFVLTPTAD